MGEVHRAVALSRGDAQQPAGQLQFAVVQSMVLTPEDQCHPRWAWNRLHQPLQRQCRFEVIPLLRLDTAGAGHDTAAVGHRRLQGLEPLACLQALRCMNGHQPGLLASGIAAG